MNLKYREVEQVAERLSNKNPCNNCGVDRQIGNPNRWECECDRCSKPYEWKNDCIKKLAEYETAEEEGRLVVLPCKVSDTVFVIENTHIEISEIYKIEIKHTAFEDRTYYLEKLAKRGMLYRYYNRDFGKTVFLTRKEAEKALKEIKKGEMTYQ